VTCPISADREFSIEIGSVADLKIKNLEIVNKTTPLLAKSKPELGLLTRWITGHCFLARHQSLIHPEIDPNCTLCEHGEETPWHLFRECPHPMVHNQLPPDSWETDELLRLINKTKFLEVLDYSDLQF